jgi:TPR repeat protein
MRSKLVTLPGVGETVDLRKIKRESRSGVMTSQAVLSFMYLQGVGVRKSERKAFKWMMRSAEQGNPPAMHTISIFLRDGVGTKTDVRSSLDWLHRAVEAGYHDSQLVLGNYHYTGTYVEKSLGRASELLSMSAEQGNPMAKMSLGMLRLFSDDDQYKDVESGLDLLKDASDAGCMEASEVLSTVYFTGAIVPENEFLGNKYIRKAAEQGSGVASLAYGGQLMYGSQYTQKDPEQGFVFLNKAYDSGIKEACSILGESYLMGVGTDKDYDKARSMFEKAIDNGSVTSMTNLGVMYMRGIGVQTDASKAVELLEKAYEGGSCAAACNLGAMYAAGEIVERDVAKSREWYLKAAEMNQIDVSKELEGLEEEAS